MSHPPSPPQRVTAGAGDAAQPRSGCAGCHGSRSRSQRELLAILDAAGRPLSVREIAGRVHRHHTWVRPHLAALVRAGDLQTTIDLPAGRGRPAMRYAVAHGPRETAAVDHVRLMGVVTRLVRDHGFSGRDVERFGESHGHALARERGGVNEVNRQLVMLGFTPRPGDDAHVLPLGDCPLADLVQRPGGALVCTVHRGIARGIAQRAGLHGARLQVAPPERGNCSLVLECGRSRTPDG